MNVPIGIAIVFATLCAGSAQADAPKVVSAHADRMGNRWSVAVTLQHEDSGWDHFANGFEVLAPDGTRLGYLELTRPRQAEPVFEATLTGLNIPAGTGYVMIRTRCSLVGWAAEPVRLDLPAP